MMVIHQEDFMTESLIRVNYNFLMPLAPQKKDKNMALQPYGLETEREQVDKWYYIIGDTRIWWWS